MKRKQSRKVRDECAMRRSVDSSAYDREYFLSDCDGYEQFNQAEGMSPRIAEALSLTEGLHLSSVLDIGSGRGELVEYFRCAGVFAFGIDYATAAIKIAAVHWRDRHLSGSPPYLCANARHIPLKDECVDAVFLLDVVEHLHRWELDTLMAEVHRVLRRGGVLVVHTAPNLWYYRWGYPWYRLVRRLQGFDLPENPRMRFRSHESVHVNEQSILGLGAHLKRAGFRADVWVTQIRMPAEIERSSPLVRVAYTLVTRVWPLKLVFCGDIFAVASKLSA